MMGHGNKGHKRIWPIALAAALAAGPIGASAAAQDITVYETPTCGCCVGWDRHLRGNGFNVTARVMSDVSAIKDQYRVPESLRSCHTAVAGGYLIEGHVPADTIKRLLRERPAAAGIAAPGMPRSAPGMDMPGEPYNVMLFSSLGISSVYERR